MYSFKMGDLKEIADSRSSSSNTIRVTLIDSTYEDFIGNQKYCFIAWQNSGLWTGPKIFEEEKYLEIWRYENGTDDGKGHLKKQQVAVFRGNQWKYVRSL